jgi:hypothetical protein
MDAKFKSKTHLSNMFFDFWQHFLLVWQFEKSTNKKYDITKMF